MWRRRAWALAARRWAPPGCGAAARPPAPLGATAGVASAAASTAPQFRSSFHSLAGRGRRVPPAVCVAGASTSGRPGMGWTAGMAGGGIGGGGAAAAAAPAAVRGVSTSSPASAAAASSSSGGPPRDYYDVLGVARSASDSDIKRAYYKLAKTHHPDTNKDDPDGAAARFQEATKAYEALRDPDKRRAYDAAGSAAAYEAGGGGPFGGGAGGPFGGGGGGGGPGPDVEDIFAAFFGGLGGAGAGGGRARRAGAGGFSWAGMGGGGGNPFANMRAAMPDAHVAVRIPFMDAIRGGKRTLNLASAGGLGGGDASPRAVEVAIPAGVDSGSILRLAGQGPRPPPGAPPHTLPGDLLIEIDVEPHPVFERVGSDIVMTAPVPVWAAIAGGSVTVPTLDGDRELAIKAGTQPGDRLRMRGYGAPRVRGGGGRGDQYVRVAVRVPRATTAAQRAAVEAARAAFEGGRSSASGGGSSADEEKKKAA